MDHRQSEREEREIEKKKTIKKNKNVCIKCGATQTRFVTLPEHENVE